MKRFSFEKIGIIMGTMLSIVLSIRMSEDSLLAAIVMLILGSIMHSIVMIFLILSIKGLIGELKECKHK